MPRPNPTLLRRMIKEWIVMADEINWEGGYHLHSEIFCIFRHKTERLLRFFDLPYTSDMIAQVFTYPFTPFINIENPCRVEMCGHMAKQAMQSYCDAIKSATVKAYKPYPHFWTLNERVEYVYFQLVFIAETGYPEID